jgi:1,4-dihydroxy-6-naphthoate synthase
VSRRLRVGLSTCPNDTFAFHGLLTGAVRVPGVELDFVLADVEELNRMLLAGALDLGKASFHAALHLAADHVVLAAGSAVGRGVGPVLLARDAEAARRPPRRVLCPGAWTTATLLYRLFHPDEGTLEQVVFSEIMPELEAGRADRGVCIHEGRFTYAARGLHLVEDLGERWERETGAPLPLGGILGRRSLGEPLLVDVSTALARSIDHARAHPDEALVTMRAHAQEPSDDVLWAHVELYVSEDTRALSPEGRGALAELGRRAAALGLGAAPGSSAGPGAPGLTVVG